MRPTRLALAAAVLMAAACSRAPAPTTTVQQYMEDEINPAAEFLFASVREVSDDKGVRLEAPRGEAQWQEVRQRLQLLHDSPKVLTAPGLKAAPPGFKAENPGVESEPADIQKWMDADPADFHRRARRLGEASAVALKAVDAKDPRALMAALDGVDKACESCHLRYFYPNDPVARKAAALEGVTD